VFFFFFFDHKHLIKIGHQGKPDSIR